MARSQLHLSTGNRATSDGVQVYVIARPAITGTTTNGQTLTASAAVVRGGPSPSEARQWFRINVANGVPTLISGATGATYVLQAGDVGNRVAVRSTITQARSVPRVVWSNQTAVVT